MNAVNLINFPDGDAVDMSPRRFALRQAHAALTQARQTATEASQADTRAATVLAAIQSELSTHVETCADLERQHAALLADQLRGNSDITNEDADAIEELSDKLADAADARAEAEIRHNSMQRAADQLRSELKAAKTAVAKAEADVRQAAQELLRSEAERLCDEYLRLPCVPMILATTSVCEV
jgi:chromosome segregation ATPase